MSRPSDDDEGGGAVDGVDSLQDPGGVGIVEVQDAVGGEDPGFGGNGDRADAAGAALDGGGQVGVEVGVGGERLAGHVHDDLAVAIQDHEVAIPLRVPGQPELADALRGGVGGAGPQGVDQLVL